MTELEKVEKLREKANVSFADAKEALDNSEGDILNALIYLENQGKVNAPAGGGFFSGADVPPQNDNANSGNYNSKTNHGTNTNNNGNGGNSGESGDEFSNMMTSFGAFCHKLFNKGMSNHLVATKGDQHLFSCPVLIVALLAVFFAPITIVLFVISLFCGFGYRFTGKDLGKDAVNNVMSSASTVVEDVKKSFADGAANNNDSE